MRSVGHFFLALIVAFSSVAGGSLLWPRLTDRPRPKLLQDVHDIVLRTSAGQDTAMALGVSDEANTERINPGEIAGSAVKGVKRMVGSRIQKIIVTNAVNQLSHQMENLSPEQQSFVQEAICKPPQAPVGETSASN